MADSEQESVKRKELPYSLQSTPKKHRNEDITIDPIVASPFRHDIPRAEYRVDLPDIAYESICCNSSHVGDRPNEISDANASDSDSQ